MSSFFTSEEPQAESELGVTPLGGSTPVPPVVPPLERASLFIEPEGQKAFPRRRPRPRARSGMLALLAYTLGGFAPAVLKQGSRRALWTSMSAYSFIVCAGMIWRWADVRTWLESGRLPLLPWLLAVVVSTMVGVISWSRAVALAGQDERFVVDRLPPFLRHPLIAGILGLLVPGFGLLVAGHPRRAAVALSGMGPLVLSVLAVWQAGWLWECNQASGGRGLPPTALEFVFIASALIGFIAVLGWFGGSLDGIRMAVCKAGHETKAPGDWLAVSLLAAIVIFIFSLGPASLARNLDHVAAEMIHGDYKLIPLCMELTAMRLDPSQPRYAMQTAEIYEKIGKHEKAQGMREELRARWETYAEMLLRGEVRAYQTLRPAPLEPEGQLLPSPGSLNRAKR